MTHVLVSDIELSTAGNTQASSLDDANNLLYVANGQHISIINTTTQLEIETIDCSETSSGSSQVQDILVDSIRNKLYITAGYYFLVYDLSTASFTTQLGPINSEGLNVLHKIVIHESENKIYVQDQYNSILIINIEDYSLIETVSNIANSTLQFRNADIYDEDVRVTTTTTRSPNSEYLLLSANSESSNVSIFDTLSDTRLDIPTGSSTYPQRIAYHSANRLAYVTNYNSNKISILDIDTNSINNTITVPRGISDIVIDESRNIMFAINSLDNTMLTINLTDNSTFNTIDLNLRPIRLFYVTSLGAIFISASDSSDGVTDNRILILNTSSFELSTWLFRPFTQTCEPFTLHYYENTVDLIPQKTLYVASPECNVLYRYERDETYDLFTSSLSIRYREAISVGRIYDIVASSQNNLLYISSQSEDKIYVVNPNIMSQIYFKIPVASGPASLSLDENDNRLYVSHPLTNKITVINTYNHTVISEIDTQEFPDGIMNINPTPPTTLPPEANTLTIPSMEINHDEEDYVVFYGQPNDTLQYNKIATGDINIPLVIKELYIYIDENGDGNSVLSNRITVPQEYINQQGVFVLTSNLHSYTSNFAAGEDYGDHRRIYLKRVLS